MLTKDLTIKTFKVQQRIQMETMESMMASGFNQHVAATQEGQMLMMQKIMVSQARAQDALFNETGIEEQLLNASIQALNLQQDPEFMALVHENMMKMVKKMQEAEGGMGGGPMGGMMGGY